MNGLAAGENYDYVVGTAPNTASFTFKAPNSAPDQPFSVSVFGDMGWLGSKERPDLVPVGGLVKNWTAVGTRATVEKLKDNKMIDFVWHLGDIACVIARAATRSASAAATQRRPVAGMRMTPSTQTRSRWSTKTCTTDS